MTKKLVPLTLSAVGFTCLAFACSSSDSSPGAGGSGRASNAGMPGMGGSASAGRAGMQGTQGGSANGGTGVGGTGVGGTGIGGTGVGGTGVGGTGVGGTSPGGGSGGSAGTSQGGSAGKPAEPSLVTSGEGAFWTIGEVTMGGSAATVTVSSTQMYQKWIGFGGTFNEAGWDALQAVSEADRNRAVQLLFSATDGIGMTWGRIPIGASDYAITRYTLNDTPNDHAMASFSIEHDRTLLLPYIKAAQAVKSDIKFWGSPWTPPPWMKDNNQYDRGAIKSDAETMAAMALYLVRFVQEYTKEGVPIDHVYPQNEPGWDQAYPSCAWGPSNYNGMTTNRPVTLGSFVEDYLAPAIKAAGLNTKIWYGTLSNNGTFEAYWNALSPAGRQLIEGVGLQWETQVRVASLASTGLLTMQSEHRCGNYPWNDTSKPAYYRFNPNQTTSGTAPNDYNYGRESWDYIKAWIEAGVNGYSAWNMVLDTSGLNLDQTRPWHQNALLAVNRSGKELIVTPTYYVFRHVGQYVEPGAVRVSATGGDALAFKNPDGSVVTILHNTGNSPSATTLSVDGKMMQFTIPALGWATVNWQG